MNLIVYLVGVMLVYLTGYLWCYVNFALELTGDKYILMLILNSVFAMLGSYLIIVGLEPD